MGFCDQLDMQVGQRLELVAGLALGDPNLEIPVAASPAAPEHEGLSRNLPSGITPPSPASPLD
jgi:hypothetical protein